MSTSSNLSTIVLGLEKTGTTGLYNKIKAIYEENYDEYISVFEPKRRPNFKKMLVASKNGTPIVTKVMLSREESLLIPYEKFDKKIMIIRDPRDMVISFLLFRPMLFNKNIDKNVMKQSFDEYIKALEERINGKNEGNSVLRLHELATSLKAGSLNWNNIVDLMSRQMELTKSHNFFVFKYDDLVEENFSSLTEYINLDNKETSNGEGDTDKSNWLSHITRSKNNGEWKNWFTAEDVDYFRPLFIEYMNFFGLDDNWELNKNQNISKKTSVDYLNKKFNILITQSNTISEIKKNKKISCDNIDLVASRANDGDTECISLLRDYYYNNDIDEIKKDYWNKRWEQLCN